MLCCYADASATPKKAPIKNSSGLFLLFAKSRIDRFFRYCHRRAARKLRCRGERRHDFVGANLSYQQHCQAGVSPADPWQGRWMGGLPVEVCGDPHSWGKIVSNFKATLRIICTYLVLYKVFIGFENNCCIQTETTAQRADPFINLCRSPPAYLHSREADARLPAGKKVCACQRSQRSLGAP